MRFIVFFTFVMICAGDEYFYNMRSWVEPVFKILEQRAMVGMEESPKLAVSLEVEDDRLNQLDMEIRKKVSLHLQKEFGHILDRMQQLIDIVKSFALDMVDNLHVAINSIENDIEGDNVEQSGQIYVNELIRRAKQAIKELMISLNYETEENIEDHLSGKVFQSLAVKIAREVLDGAEFANMEATVLKQVEVAIDAVFKDDNQVIESGLYSDVLEDLQSSLRPFLNQIKGHEAKFNQWMHQLIKDGVYGAKPQLQLLHGYAKQVITEGCQLCQKVCEKAYNYFERYQDNMGDSWSRIQRIVELIKNEETV